jgi:hypothetical protein
MDHAVRDSLKDQFHAALAMLRHTIDACPDDLWAADTHPSPYWQVAYHTIFYTHLYLGQSEDAFQPWSGAREQAHFLESLPWPPHDEPEIGPPYTKEQLLEYWQLLDDMADEVIDDLDLQTDDPGFWWYEGIDKLSHEWMNVRHVQHHVGQLSDRLAAAGVELPWLGPRPK